MMFRAFVAVPVPPEPALGELAEALSALPADLNVTDPAKHHLTLSFLGDVPEDAAPALSQALDAATAGQPPFRLRLHGVGAFPDARRPRVVWAGARPEPALDRLAQRTRERLAQAGFPGDDKPFRVHLTLARTRSPRGLPEVAAFVARHAQHELPALAVEEVRLYRSRLHPAGARHDVLHASPLRSEA